MKGTIAVCVPAGNQVQTGFAFDLARMMAFTAANSELELRLFFSQGCAVAAQRNSLVEQALATDATHVLWLDSDMRFPRETLLHLLGRQVPFVGANYATRTMPVSTVAFTDEKGAARLQTKPTDSGVVPVHATGFGVALEDTAALRRLTAPHFDVQWSKESLQFTDECVYHCRQLAAAGVDILVDHDLSKHVHHVGSFEFRHAHANALVEESHGADNVQ